MIYKRFIVLLVAFIVIALIYFFPNGSDEEVYKQNITYKESNKSPIYLKDNNEYVVRTDIIINADNIDSKIKEIIESLIINGSKKEYLPNGFTPLIPENTKLLSYDLDNGLLKLNFSQELLNVNIDNEEKMIESIVYSLTEINEIKRIMIFVNNELLLRLPNSNRKIPKYIDRTYGINKIFNVNSLDDTTMTTIYFYNKYNNKNYYIPVSIFNNDQSSKIEIVINNLKSNSITNTNLLSYMVNSVELLSFEKDEYTASLNFNNYIFDNFDDKTIQEEVKYSIFLSLKDNLGIKSVIFNVNNEKIDELSIEK